MVPAARAALDRMMYEQAAVIHMLRIAPPEAWERSLPGDDERVCDLVAALTEHQAALASWLAATAEGRSLEEGDCGSGPDGPASLEETTASLERSLRSIVATAAAIPDGGFTAGTLRELWWRSRRFTEARTALLAALPEAAADPVILRWCSAPEPPAEPPLAGDDPPEAV
jgi:hypothetical protein